VKLKGKIADLEADYDELKEKHEGLEIELEDLKGCIIQEHINGFQKGFRLSFAKMWMCQILGSM